ncbi:hypothetical protein [Agrobacterium rosae]|uniref:Lipoprotein n=1 Tax=Agrobacterium rosae TaxID=1972867 RepID=A0A1R3TXX8_9HYPH|nr:hypothetical protein [Agrobacterium rosae]SCX31815.1 hypothetical protein DSM25559_3808 [Agrobacterium rosae]
MSYRVASLVAIVAPIVTSGCVAPNFDVGKINGAPTVASIERRIVCELVDLVRDKPRRSDPANWTPFDNVTSIRDGKYQVVVDLSLLVTETGELTPNLNFIRSDVLSINTGFKVSRTRKQNFAERLSFSMPELLAKYHENGDFGACPLADTNLAGDLGIRKMAELAMTTRYRELAETKDFGGYVSFDVYYDVNATGPTWKVATFEGPGKLGKLSHQDTDQLTFAFIPTTTAEGTISPAEASKRAREFLQQLNLNRLGDRLSN